MPKAKPANEQRETRNSIPDNHARWLEKSRESAAAMVKLGAGYHVAVRMVVRAYGLSAIRHFEEEKASDASTKAAALVGVSRGTLARLIRAAGDAQDGATSPAMMTALDWGAYFVRAKASYREVLFVTKRSLLEAAIRLCDGNRLKASRVLKVQRNTVWRIPQKADQVSAMPGRRRAA